MNAVTFASSVSLAPRVSRRVATRRDVVLPCQAVRESDFTLVADRTLDISVDGLLLPVKRTMMTGEPLLVSFQIPGLWIDAECIVTRVIQGRRPCDDGLLAVGVLFDGISPAARAALAGFLHGRPPPLPRRGPLARLRRGEDGPQLADVSIMDAPLAAPESTALALEHDVEEIIDGVDPVGILRELASAWRALSLEGEQG
ncbi:MAG: hypothetical protein JWP97_6770 [Labilithrix sp.]|nr:hypothetical protein [Labilithrix sp.]